MEAPFQWIGAMAMTLTDRLDPAVDGGVRRLLGLRAGVALSGHGDDLEIAHPWGRQVVRGLGADTVERMLRLAAAATDIEELAAGGGARLLGLLARLPYLVTTTLADAHGLPLVTAVPIARSAPLLSLASSDPQPTLSRFAYLRRLRKDGADSCVLESPLSPFRLTLHQPTAGAFVTALTMPGSGSDAPAAGLGPTAALAFTGLLAGAGLLESPQASTAPGATASVELEDWDFHDLLFHSRSRPGRHDYPTGGLFANRHLPRPPALPGTGPREEGPGIDLPVPDWDAVVARDPAFGEVLEGRTSVRSYAEEPVTLDQLGELLYRAARARRVGSADPADPTGYDPVERPYPTGGAMGELEIHLAVARCTGLTPGVYRYDSAAHRLRPRPWSSPADQAAFVELLAGARGTTGGAVDPQVMFTVTSRIGRLSWKYSQIAYALTLKHVGVLYQTLYLVATAMGLAPCAMGSGDTDVAARALGLDWTVEPPVGEFLIGSGPSEAPAPVAGFADLVSETRHLDG